MSKLAVVRVRGNAAVPEKLERVLNLLNLGTRNHCVVLDDNKTNKGMIQKAQNFVTWGEVDDETIKLLEDKKRGDSKSYNLSPPEKGFEMGGVGRRWKEGGALGYRGEKINELVRRML